MKKLILIILAICAFALPPVKKITYNGYISKITYNNTYLIAGLENGTIVIKDFKTFKNIGTITLPKIHDFMGDLISMPIYSLDISPDNKHLMILAEGEDAKRELFIYDFNSKKLDHIFTTKETLMKGTYIGDNKIFFALLSDEALLYDLKNNKNIYRTQVGNYVFSTYAVNKNKTLAVFGDESGALKVVDIKTGKKLKELKGFNKDKTLSCDIEKNLAINGSSDMRVAVYDINSGYSKLTLKVKFLPYGATISPDLSKFAVQYNEKNDIAIYSMYNKLLFVLNGHTMALNGIKFLNNDTIISFSPAEILIWKLK
ncbi:periplasmic nitrate reductase, NapL subunit [Nautilia profundicola AmH]|uniref:Periplasmic nitrate reductase, NapL subunit n=1 Tax=Nautilia profundicola (strain ATCC BAA-1463 / DSM 18972 / AmH) TaxID=598659 RepID=B9L8K9_NAUPA|nr:nitrate reductase [Nautilia profundicola]ACM93765.1 periplasmic nitrate reductase, NapL subunit [Nautilia profundicola AmH]